MVKDHVLLYDGLCGFCDRVVQFVIARERGHTMRFAPLQGEFARRALERHPHLRGIDSLIVITNDFNGHEEVATRSAAIILIGEYIGGVWGVAATLSRIAPRAVGDWGYDHFARRRYRWFGRYDACRIPTVEQRGRFIE